jgi:hypothetical protein
MGLLKKITQELKEMGTYETHLVGAIMFYEYPRCAEKLIPLSSVGTFREDERRLTIIAEMRKIGNAHFDF